MPWLSIPPPPQKLVSEGAVIGSSRYPGSGMDGSGYQELEAGVYAGLVLASAATTPQQPNRVHGSKAVDRPATSSAPPPASNDSNDSSSSSSSSSSQGVVCTPSPPGAVKPARLDTTGSSSSRSGRRLTSLSIRNAGCNDDYEAATTSSEGDGRANLSDYDRDAKGIVMGQQRRRQMQQMQQQQLYPTPGSTAHTGSTSSFSTLSVASMNNNVPREGTARVPDIRTIVDLATGRSSRFTASKICPSPSSPGSTCSGASLSSHRSACPSSPGAPSDQQRREEPPRGKAPPPPGSLVRDQDSRRASASHAPRIYSEVAETLAREEESAAWACAAATARAKPSSGANNSSSSSSSQGRWQQQHLALKDDGSLRRHAAAAAAAAAASDSASARRPALNPYRTKTSPGSYLPREYGAARIRHRSTQDERANTRGAGRPGPKLKVEPESGGCSPPVSSPSASSVEWIWPEEGVRRRPPLLSGPCHGAGFGGARSPAAATREVSLSSSRPRHSSFSSISSSSSFSFSPPTSRSFAFGSAMTPSAGDAAPDNADGGGDNAGRFFSPSPLLSNECCDPRVPRQPATTAPAEAHSSVEPGAVEGVMAAASYRREQRASAAAATAPMTASSPAPSTATTATGAAPSTTTTPTRKLRVSPQEAFVPDGFGGWVGPLTTAPLPPRSKGGRVSSVWASRSASSLPSASSGGKTDVTGEDEEDVFDLAPLPTRVSACTRRGSSTCMAAARSGRRSSANSNGNGVPGRMTVGRAPQASAPGGGGSWWRAVRSLCVDGNGEPSPVQRPWSASEDDSNFLNPFSPASSRRFSSTAPESGPSAGRYGNGGGGSGGGVSSSAAAAASRFSAQVLHPIAEFCCETRIVGCVFGEEGDDDASDGEVGIIQGQLERRCPEQQVGRGEDRRETDHGAPAEGGRSKHGEKERDRSSPFPLRIPSPAPHPLVDDVWPLPVAVLQGNAPAAAAAAAAAADVATTKTSTMSHSTLPVSPEPSSALSDRSTCFARSASASAAATATASANAAASAAALARQASVAADVAAATAKQAQDACKLRDYVNAAGAPYESCDSPWPPRGPE